MDSLPMDAIMGLELDSSLSFDLGLFKDNSRQINMGLDVDSYFNFDLFEDQSKQTILTESSSSKLNKDKKRKKSASLEVKSSKPIIKNQKMHRPIFEEGGIADGTTLFYMSKGEKVLKGSKKGRGILCTCCGREISASQFESHAGGGKRRKPYDNIFVNGISLHAYASHLKRAGKHMALINDDACGDCEEAEEDKDLVLL
ncbi:uncharacterized protein LOC143618955 isoform X2 [Bidens hawaiensis]|uniref:uncharacterized protein LOC143618955 isoform X2 n=1 Tax=Bidens hawaiensis TaxID=980011 RepID=UPI00404920DC